jgi:RNA polymerase sigma-70 factor (ECF subfamily)
MARMPDRDTSIGGQRKDFPETTWGLVRRMHVDPSAALETLCARYWKPVHQFVRAAWAKTNEDAKDLTQAFFMWLLESQVTKKFDPARGSFRSFLKSLLRHFVAHQNDALKRLKRGGGKRVLPLDDEAAAAEAADPKESNPEVLFDRAWVSEVTRRALDRVRRRHASDGRSAQWRAFEEYDLAKGEQPTYAALASKLGVKESDVRNYLFAVRERVREEIRAELSETVADERELQAEWDTLFGK